MTLLIGFLVVFAVQGLNNGCPEHEYSTGDGRCCPKCYAGAVVRRDCTDQIGTSCIPCENGTFINQPNGLNECFPCTSCVTANGLFVKQACTATTDTVCDVLNGYMCTSFSEVTGCSVAQKHSICASGQQIKEPGTNVKDTVCEDCPDGYSSPDGVKCVALTNDTVQPEDSSNDVVHSNSAKNYDLSYNDLLYLPLLIIVLQLFSYFF